MSEIVYCCSRCVFTHHDLITCHKHMKSVHNLIPIFQCKICHEKYKGEDEFDKHLQFTHGTNHWDLNLAMKQSLRDLRKIDDNL